MIGQQRQYYILNIGSGNDYLMNPKDQIIKAIDIYLQGMYTTQDFCNVFVELYYFETSGNQYFKGKEKCELDHLAQLAERFTTSVEDVLKFPNYYTSEKQIWEAANSTKGALKDN